MYLLSYTGIKLGKGKLGVGIDLFIVDPVLLWSKAQTLKFTCTELIPVSVCAKNIFTDTVD